MKHSIYKSVTNGLCDFVVSAADILVENGQIMTKNENVGWIVRAYHTLHSLKKLFVLIHKKICFTF